MMRISRFNLIFEKVMGHCILESGNMFPDSTPIKRENIAPTIKKIEEELFIPLGISKDLWSPEIGSAAEGGKKPVCGDLDIAVNFAAIDENGDANAAKTKIKDLIVSKGFELREVGALLSVNFPIQGTQLGLGEKVQVDLFNATDLDYVKFTHYSPRPAQPGKPLGPDESKYKGAHRALILASLIRAVTTAVADDATDTNPYVSAAGYKYPAYRFKHLSILDDGIYEVTKTFLGKKGFKKHEEKDKSKSKFITNDPQEMLDIVFGKGKYTLKDIQSFEAIWNNILMSPDFQFKDKVDDICKALWNNINNDRKKHPEMQMPDELQSYVEEHHLIEANDNMEL